MSMEYKYTIVDVNEQARTMEIVFESEGNPMQHIGARLPYENELLQSVVMMYAPIAYWAELKAKVVAPEIGTTGTVPFQNTVEEPLEIPVTEI